MNTNAEGERARRGAREALWAAAGLLLVLGVGKQALLAFPYGADIVFTAAAAFQLYVPLTLIARDGELPESHGIHVHGLLLGPIAALRARIVLSRFADRRDNTRSRSRTSLTRFLAYYGRGARFRPRALFDDLGFAALAAAVTFPPFAVAHHFFQAWIRDDMSLQYTLQIPDDILWTLLRNVFLVALPEELFYRGFVQTRLLRRWPNELSVWMMPLGRAVFVTSGLFALGHFLGEWNLARLGPFFPAFLFSALVLRSRSIAGAVFYHALSNAFSVALLYGYR